jgi:hypothetical protein
VQWSDDLPAAKDDRLGDAAYPVCNATGGCATDNDPVPTMVRELHRVDPHVALVARTQGIDRFAVFGPLHAEPTEFSIDGSACDSGNILATRVMAEARLLTVGTVRRSPYRLSVIAGADPARIDFRQQRGADAV